MTRQHSVEVTKYNIRQKSVPHHGNFVGCEVVKPLDCLKMMKEVVEALRFLVAPAKDWDSKRILYTCRINIIWAVIGPSSRVREDEEGRAWRREQIAAVLQSRGHHGMEHVSVRGCESVIFVEYNSADPSFLSEGFPVDPSQMGHSEVGDGEGWRPNDASENAKGIGIEGLR